MTRDNLLPDVEALKQSARWSHLKPSISHNSPACFSCRAHPTWKPTHTAPNWTAEDPEHCGEVRRRAGPSMTAHGKTLYAATDSGKPPKQCPT